MKRFSEEEEADIIRLMEKGNSLAIFGGDELGKVDRLAFMEALFAFGYGLLQEVEQGVRCPDCLGVHDKENGHVH